MGMSGSRGVWIESYRGSSEEESEVHVIRIHHDSVVGSSEYFLHGRRRCIILRVETNLCPFHSQRGCEEMHHAAGCIFLGIGTSANFQWAVYLWIFATQWIFCQRTKQWITDEVVKFFAENGDNYAPVLPPYTVTLLLPYLRINFTQV